MFVVTILGVPSTELSDAFQANNISGLDPLVIKEAFGMEFLPYPGEYFRIEDYVFRVSKVAHKAGSDKVKMFVELPDPEPPVDPPIANIISGGGTIASGAFAIFSADPTGGDSATWSWEYDSGGGWVEFSTSKEETGKFFPPAPGIYSIRVTITNTAGTDTDTKTNYLTVTL